jgi:hypothetical protein
MNFRRDRIAAKEIMRDLFFAILFLTELRANQRLKRHLFHASRARTPNDYRPNPFEALEPTRSLILPSDTILPMSKSCHFSLFKPS